MTDIHKYLCTNRAKGELFLRRERVNPASLSCSVSRGGSASGAKGDNDFSYFSDIAPPSSLGGLEWAEETLPKITVRKMESIAG